MAFTFTTTKEYIASGSRVLCGTYTNTGGSTGGDITPGTSSTSGFPQFQKLVGIDSVSLTPVAAAVVANQHVVNSSFPVKASKFTVVTGANESGVWSATGY